MTSIKNQPAQSETRARRLIRDLEELAFLDCFSGAVVSASAAADTNISIDDVLLVALGDSLNGAVVSAGTALDASISDIVSHGFPSKYMFFAHGE